MMLCSQEIDVFGYECCAQNSEPNKLYATPNGGKVVTSIANQRMSKLGETQSMDHMR